MPLVNDLLSFAFSGQNPFEDRMLRDSRHARHRFETRDAQTEQDFGGRPKPKFLFGVRFITQFNSPAFGQFSDQNGDVAFMVKTVDKPKIDFDVTVMNQYNKRRLVQTKIKYQPINMRFYDSVDERLSKFILSYMQHYYGDHLAENVDQWSYDKISSEFNNGVDGWGYRGISQPGRSNSAPFMSHIELYQFFGGNFSRWVFVNPLITSFDHDNVDAESGNVAQEASMSVEFEGLLYREKNIPLATSKVGRAAIDFFKLEEFADNLELPDALQIGGLNLGGISDLASARSVFGRELGRKTIEVLSGSPIDTSGISRTSSSALTPFGNFDFGSVIVGEGVDGLISSGVSGSTGAVSNAIRAGTANVARDALNLVRGNILGTGGTRLNDGAASFCADPATGSGTSPSASPAGAAKAVGQTGGFSTPGVAADENSAVVQFAGAVTTGVDTVVKGVGDGLQFGLETIGLRNSQSTTGNQIGVTAKPFVDPDSLTPSQRAIRAQNQFPDNT